MKIYIAQLKSWWRPWPMRVIGLRLFAFMCLALFPLVCFVCAFYAMLRERHEYHELWLVLWRLFTGQVEFVRDDSDNENK